MLPSRSMCSRMAASRKAIDKWQVLQEVGATRSSSASAREIPQINSNHTSTFTPLIRQATRYQHVYVGILCFRIRHQGYLLACAGHPANGPAAAETRPFLEPRSNRLTPRRSTTSSTTCRLAVRLAQTTASTTRALSHSAATVSKQPLLQLNSLPAQLRKPATSYTCRRLTSVPKASSSTQPLTPTARGSWAATKPSRAPRSRRWTARRARRLARAPAWTTRPSTVRGSLRWARCASRCNK